MRKISKVLFVIAILSFIIIFALKMENNYQMEQFYTEREKEAKQELALLENANGQQEYFEITDDKIEVINTATSFVNTIGDFADWCEINFETYVDKCYYVFEDFVNSNDHIIPKIDGIMTN